MVDLKFTSVQTLKNVIVTLFDRKLLAGQEGLQLQQKINKIDFVDSNFEDEERTLPLSQ